MDHKHKHIGKAKRLREVERSSDCSLGTTKRPEKGNAAGTGSLAETPLGGLEQRRLKSYQHLSVKIPYSV